MMLKPSAAPCVNHGLDRVGDLLGRAGEGEVAAPAAEPPDQLPHGEALAPGQLDDERVAALGALDRALGRQVGGQLAVQLQRPGRQLQQPLQAAHAVRVHDVVLQDLLGRQRLGLGRADDRDDAGQHLDVRRGRGRPPPYGT